MLLPDPIIDAHEDIFVVRDDLIEGGTKRRVIHVLFDEHEEYVYASPVFGYAQVALAYACRDAGKRATIFCAERKHRQPLTLEAEAAGAKIIEIKAGYLVVVQARAREYAAMFGAKLLPFGLNDPLMVTALADVARRVPMVPKEVWTVVGSGTLSRALQQAWPGATFFGVKIGAEPDAGRCVKVFTAPEKYQQAAAWPPPFPSCANYDSKCWRYLKGFASPGALFWNVAP